MQVILLIYVFMSYSYYCIVLDVIYDLSLLLHLDSLNCNLESHACDSNSVIYPSVMELTCFYFYV